MKNIFTIIPQFLKNPEEFFQSVQRNEQLSTKALSLFISTVVFLAVYGFMTGLSHSWLQATSSAAKIPFLFLLTLVFTLPALYFFALALLNVQFSVAQASVVVLSGIGVTAFLLLGLSPVTLFFVLTSSSYPFFQLLAVLFMAVSGFTGLRYILRGFKSVDKDRELTSGSLGNSLLQAWVVLYGFVGAQMTWRLSPLIGDPQEPFYWLRPSRDNFFVDVINALEGTLGVGGAGRFDAIGVFFWLLVIALAIGVWFGSKRTVSRSNSSYQPVPQQEKIQSEQSKSA
ncbi:MAG: hypothetical protein WCC12_19765 [Anaerolineales bacterium]